MRGRKPKPSALRLIEGNPGRRPINQQEPKVPALTDAAAPEFLDAAAKQEWARQSKELIPLGFVGACDLGVLAVYCDAWGDFVRAAQGLQTGGDVIRIKGRPVPNPLLRIKRDARRDIIKAASELGISPSSRSRVKILDSNEEEKDPAAEFFR